MANDKWQSKQVPAAAYTMAAEGPLEFGQPAEGQTGIPIRLVARTGKAVDHPYWGRVVHDLDGMTAKARIPLDYVHDADQVIGYLSDVDKSSGKVVCRGELVPFGSDRAAEIAHKGPAGVPYEASIYFADAKIEEVGEGQTADANGQTFKGPAIIIRQWTLRGVAVCPYGVDRGTSVKLAEGEQATVFFKRDETMGEDEKKIDEEEKLDEAPAAALALAEKPAEKLAEPAGQPPDRAAEGQRFLAAYGSQGGVWFAEGLTFEQARDKHQAALQSRVTDLEKRLAAVGQSGAAAPVSATPEDADQDRMAVIDTPRVQRIGRSRAAFAATLRLPGMTAAERQKAAAGRLSVREAATLLDDARARLGLTAWTMPTLLDIAKLNGTDNIVGLIEEASKVCPAVRMGYARTISGLNYRTKVRTAVPVASFRSANAGTTPVISTFENRLVETYILNPRWECDKAVADRDEDGAAAYIAVEAAGILEGAMQLLEKCFFYGTNTTYGGDAKAFPGLLDMYDSTNMVIDAGGTTATTGSSVWAVRFGPQHCGWVWGANGDLAVSDVMLERILDGDSKPYTAYVQELLGYPGLQVGSIYSVARIKKLTADSGKTLTDDMIAALLALFPSGTQPDVLFMSRRSLSQLQSSRTATNPTGAPAPFPVDYQGIGGMNIPIRVTDGLSIVEALTL